MARGDSDSGEKLSDNLGVLLGWRSAHVGERIVLTLQNASQFPHCHDDVHEFRYFISREQAIQLGHNLYQLAEATPPHRKRTSMIERVFGR